MRDPSYDVILVGAGLANGLIAMRLRQSRPALRVAMFEAGDRVGGNHTWSFHLSDLTQDQMTWVEPLIETRWPGYSVLFPIGARTFEGEYLSITSERFHRVVSELVGAGLHLNCDVQEVNADAIVMRDGTRHQAALIIDGRGPCANDGLALGFQSFLGREVQLAAPHGLDCPIIMDASVEQQDGYRFVYVLPFAPDRLLIEDTHYVDRATVPEDALQANIDQYIQARGWRVIKTWREERGSLPIVLAGDPDRLWPDEARTPRVGLRGSRFHQTTGYSLPDAVRVAELITSLSTLTSAAVHAALAVDGRKDWRAQGFYRLLNRMLFMAGRPQDRWRAMQRFYALPAGLIRRFYARRLTWADRMRILSGKPPVPVWQAARAAAKTHLKDFKGRHDKQS